MNFRSRRLLLACFGLWAGSALFSSTATYAQQAPAADTTRQKSIGTPAQAPAALASATTGQPQLPLPQASPHAVIAQTLGLTDVTVDYHSPAVRSRAVWGALVPYNQVWRAGANENTLITFSRPVKLNGKDVAAGQYSLYVYPRADSEWDFILNRVTTHWGTENYDPKDDVVHVPVLPEKANFQETLLYWFSEVKPASGRLNLTWERRTLSMLIETDVQTQVLAGIAQTLTQHPGNWQLLAQAADYLVQNNLQPELALRYINESLRLNDAYANNWIKAQLLASQQDYTTALIYTRKALKLGSKDDDDFKNQQATMRVALTEWQAKAY
ncbi:DUF2911 domain-containing protein [Hymenobacter profundi]|uniref:DUF2911 domain-containing protein n=1 Tax=Hymenobacter profundi TaxID=1982110 RepID=A0ABS6WXF9_9BACT|nr:DUF2911 domain-containing protein [Hymenobacter profundi]MBW3128196.1 DUF2911 domain-containing protein [Hymenobacter profundi]